MRAPGELTARRNSVEGPPCTCPSITLAGQKQLIEACKSVRDLKKP